MKNMIMLERHYFRGKCIRSFEFDFNFVMPDTENSIEFIYDLPNFSPEEKAEIVASPWEVKSDTFFFAENKLIIHNRAEYNYAPLDE